MREKARDRRRKGQVEVEEKMSSCFLLAKYRDPFLG